MKDRFTCAVAGAKGGVGKTTTSINLGASLAAAGYATVTVELDLAMANHVDFLDIDIDVTEATTLHDVLAGKSDVEAATYDMNPEQSGGQTDPVLYIKTEGGDPLDALREATDGIQEDAAEFRDEFEDAVA